MLNVLSLLINVFTLDLIALYEINECIKYVHKANFMSTSCINNIFSFVFLLLKFSAVEMGNASMGGAVGCDLWVAHIYVFIMS
jgi:hypothetical protein